MKIYLLFDPIQNPLYGGTTVEGLGYTYRSIQSQKYGYKSIYIPYGPVCENYLGLENFIKDIKKSKLSRIKIDLPYIPDETDMKKVQDIFMKNGFKKSNYIQDEETLIILRENFQGFNSKTNYYIRKAKENIEIIEDPEEKHYEDIYQIYKDHADFLGYKPKVVDVFHDISKKGKVYVAMDKSNGSLLGYLISELSNRITENGHHKIMQIVFSNVSKIGREKFVGYSLYSRAIEDAFVRQDVDIVDLFGASRTKERSYLKFKTYFSENFVKLPGSFEKIYVI